jgi:hypothetical protein
MSAAYVPWFLARNGLVNLGLARRTNAGKIAAGSLEVWVYGNFRK